MATDRLIDEEHYAAARERIAAQRGILRGWRPLHIGEGVAVVAAQVLGMASGLPGTVGLRLMVAARDPVLLEAFGNAAVAQALRKRGILADDDDFSVVNVGELVSSASPVQDDDLLTWPFAPVVVHVPVHRLPAIAGLTTNQVHGARDASAE